VEKEMKAALAQRSRRREEGRKRLELERRKLRNLIAALEGGSSAPATILKAISEREQVIGQLQDELRQDDLPRPHIDPGELPELVKQQLTDLASLLRSDVARVKAEFRRLNLALLFEPVEAQPRAYYVVKGQCDLSALIFSFVRPALRQIPARPSNLKPSESMSASSGAAVRLLLERLAPGITYEGPPAGLGNNLGAPVSPRFEFIGV
jgi:hypothetical protein